jgi:hypothetical protein
MQTIETGRCNLQLRRYTDKFDPKDRREVTCEELEAHWPAMLVRACVDPYGYALGLRGGTVLHFAQAQLTASGNWVHLRQVKVLQGSLPTELLPDREIEVPVREIVWVGEAPD